MEIAMPGASTDLARFMSRKAGRAKPQSVTRNSSTSGKTLTLE
jgi:hypothetical protein